MFDRDVLARQDDAFDEQSHQALATREVQLLEPCTQGGRERGEIIREAVEPGPIQVLCGEFLGTRMGSGPGLLESFATSPKLLDAQRPPIRGAEDCRSGRLLYFGRAVHFGGDVWTCPGRVDT